MKRLRPKASAQHAPAPAELVETAPPPPTPDAPLETPPPAQPAQVDAAPAQDAPLETAPPHFEERICSALESIAHSLQTLLNGGFRELQRVDDDTRTAATVAATAATEARQYAQIAAALIESVQAAAQRVTPAPDAPLETPAPEAQPVQVDAAPLAVV